MKGMTDTKDCFVVPLKFFGFNYAVIKLNLVEIVVNLVNYHGDGYIGDSFIMIITEMCKVYRTAIRGIVDEFSQFCLRGSRRFEFSMTQCKKPVLQP